MKTFILISFIILLSPLLHAETLQCEFSESANVIDSRQVILENSDEKVLINRWPDLTAYIKKISAEQFELEAFIDEQEIRLYATGALSKISPLSLTVWSRQNLLSISCKK